MQRQLYRRDGVGPSGFSCDDNASIKGDALLAYKDCISYFESEMVRASS